MTQPYGIAKEAGSSTRNCLRWSLTEDRALVSAMQDLLDLDGWKTDNGQFKNGAYAKFEALMEQKLPGCGKKAKPHIESRVKTLRIQYDAITEMLSPQASGFGWNDEEKHVTCERSVWDIWVKSHKNAPGLRNKSFSLYDDLGIFFGKDRAKGDEGESLQDALGEMEDEEGNEQEEEVFLSNTQERSSPPPRTQEEPTPSIAHTSTRTKKARTETIVALEEFSTKLDKMSDVMEAAGEHIGRLANCFKHESESAERRMQVTSEVMKIEGLTSAEVLFASKKNCHKSSGS
ncbi:hypothetical protein RND81_13G064100 [Saponaria officinalis]|uniref:Myb/SANT-like domain-containing protein n=1 Tax=Saponaria officinalis TaxID=3572 RepID=A0AAW1GUL2_SAPOF